MTDLLSLHSLTLIFLIVLKIYQSVCVSFSFVKRTKILRRKMLLYIV